MLGCVATVLIVSEDRISPELRRPQGEGGASQPGLPESGESMELEESELAVESEELEESEPAHIHPQPNRR